jgi:hypothetical protein
MVPSGLKIKVFLRSPDHLLAADTLRPTAEVAVSLDVVYYRRQICEAYVHRGSDSGVPCRDRKILLY